jgi:outer membrane cobalamin receptor
MYLLARLQSARMLAALGPLAVLGCASGGPREPAEAPPVGRIITAEKIRETGAASAWDALKYTVRSHYFADYRGEPQRIFTNRGVGSMVLREEPLIFLDGTRLADIQLLRQLSASVIETIQVLNSADGTTYYGTSAVAGVILIVTTMGGKD